ncbi:unnamed protein product [Cuscuta epithymum]|uniref:WIYLD domain-containing protein n=1 Tax=Cuscuta epithymum TaxID=186058 RepID=A0AAV0C040_9ASTE|nr:unnamed protein product [Cuscuta epithymum]
MAPRGRPRKRSTRMYAAIDAMRNLGFDEEVVVQTVKQLLGIYGGEDGWPFIEEYGYKELIDAILRDSETPREGNLEKNESLQSEAPNARAEDVAGSSSNTAPEMVCSEVGDFAPEGENISIVKSPSSSTCTNNVNAGHMPLVSEDEIGLKETGEHHSDQSTLILKEGSKDNSISSDQTTINLMAKISAVPAPLEPPFKIQENPVCEKNLQRAATAECLLPSGSLQAPHAKSHMPTHSSRAPHTKSPMTTHSSRAPPVECLVSTPFSWVPPVECHVSTSSSRAPPVECLGSASSSRAPPVECLGSASSSRALPVEGLVSASSSRALPVERRVSVSSSQASPGERLVPASSSQAPPGERLFSASSSRAPPVEPLVSAPLQAPPVHPPKVSPQPVASHPPRRRFPCYGWIDSDDEDEPELMYLPRVGPADCPTQFGKHGTNNVGVKRQSRWDQKPENV